MMDEKEFWNIISMFDWKHSGDDDQVLKRAVQYLATKSNEEIFQFDNILSKLLYDLDGIEYARNIGEDSYVEGGYFSLDCFLYSRCVVVANGRDYYYSVLNNPKNMPKDMEFESLLYIGHTAYEIKNNGYYEHVTTYDIETFSNKEKWAQPN